MREFTYERLDQTVYEEKLPNGLSVYLLPKPGFQQTFATFTTHYGSIDRTFKTGDDKDFHTVPDGIAHFLEHKMFEKEQGDIFPLFASHGASANAFTTFDMTTYLFSCTEDVGNNTETLLDFVQEPYFSEKSVEKEKGIIGQEIRMYDDNPDWKLYFGLLQAMYKEHPVRIAIAGTVESIAEIDKDTLYRCYNTFYHPSNMVLVAAGGFDPESMMALIRDNQAKKEFAPAPAIERKYPQESKGVDEQRVTVHLGVSQPKCFIGWKDETIGLTGRDLLHQELLTGVVLDVLFGRSSDFYDDLISKGLVDQSFSWEYECTPTYAHSLVGGNTSDVDTLISRVDEEIRTATASGLREEDFTRARNKEIGRFISAMDSPAFVARNFVGYHFKGADLFDAVDVLEKLTLDHANARLRSHFSPAGRAVSTVLPNS